MQQDQVIKISFEGKIKRVALMPEYTSLLTLIPEVFEELQDSKFFLSYIDDEHDKISIENQKDFMSATNYALNANIILKIYIERNEQMRELQLIKGSSIQTSFVEESTSTYDYVSLKCENCQRVFNHQRSYEIHSNVCLKVFSTKRTPFNSHLIRMRGIAFRNNITLLHLTTLYIMKSQYPIRVDRQRRACFHCNRKFALNAFDVHEKICMILHTKRTPFDSKKQRMIKDESVIIKNEEFAKKKPTSSGMSQWKKDSLRFRNIMKIQRMLLRN